MSKQVLNVGTTNNDKSGDSLRAGGLKIKANFDELYAALGAPAAGVGAGVLPMHPVCINGRYQDLRDLPPFKPLALTADWADLENKPLLSILTAPPTGPSGLTGVNGHKRGMIASDNTHFYMCFADWVSPGTDTIWRRIEWNPTGGSGSITFPITQEDYNSPTMITATSSDTNWNFGFYNDGGSTFYTQVGFYGDGQTNRGFRILDNSNSKQWTFDGQGNLILPSGGDIKDSSGNSVLGGGSGGATPGVVTVETFNGDWHTPTANPQVYNIADYGEPNVFVMSQNGAQADLLVKLPANPTHGKQFTIKFTGGANPAYHMIVQVDGGGMIDNQSAASIDITKDNGFLNVVWDSNWNTYWVTGKDLA